MKIMVKADVLGAPGDAVYMGETIEEGYDFR
jgi:hypothetical protein